MLMTGRGSNLGGRSNICNYEPDAVMGGRNGGNAGNYRCEIQARRISTAASRSSSSLTSPQPPTTHQHWTRGREYPSPDDHRHWTYNKAPPPSSAGRFIVVSFNILGVDNADQHLQELYRHIPHYIMKWNYRKLNILKELGLWSPDIICLQEVDRFDDLQNDLVRQGYEGIHKGRTGGSTDGCAIFWRSRKFVLLQEESIEYQELDLRHNVAQLCVLRTRYEEQKQGKGKRPKAMEDNLVVICNIHVLFNPNRGEIKLGQVRHLLKKAHSLSEAWGGIPIIVAGDFNSIPQSPLYRYLRYGMLDVSEYDRREISGQQVRSQEFGQTRIDRWTSSSTLEGGAEGHTTLIDASVVSSDVRLSEKPCLDAVKWTPEELEKATGMPSECLVKHDLELRSAYSFIGGSLETRDTNNEPLVTTYHGKFMGTVDYIWFTKGLTPVRVLELLPVHILQRYKGLPSKKWGSDHLALACEFAFEVLQPK